MGDRSSRKLIVLLGDSHAHVWLPALLEMAWRDHWQVIPLLRLGCTPGSWVPEWRTRQLPRVVRLGREPDPPTSPDRHASRRRHRRACRRRYTSAATAEVIAAARSLHRIGPTAVIGDPEGLDRDPIDCLLSGHASMARCTTTWPAASLGAYNEVAFGHEASWAWGSSGRAASCASSASARPSSATRSCGGTTTTSPPSTRASWGTRFARPSGSPVAERRSAARPTSASFITARCRAADAGTTSPRAAFLRGLRLQQPADGRHFAREDHAHDHTDRGRPGVPPAATGRRRHRSGSDGRTPVRRLVRRGRSDSRASRPSTAPCRCCSTTGSGTGMATTASRRLSSTAHLRRPRRLRLRRRSPSTATSPSCGARRSPYRTGRS